MAIHEQLSNGNKLERESTPLHPDFFGSPPQNHPNPQCICAAGGSAVVLLHIWTSHRNQEKMSSESYVFQNASPESSNDQDEIDSLPSSMDSSDFESIDESDAQKEWEASLQQLELILTMVIVPYTGKYFGRKFAYWSE
jgi:hypothetical protein